MLIGYARTSTTDQDAGLDAQHRDLAQAGVEKMFSEQLSSMAQRPQLEAAIEFARAGDTFVVTKLDRLARSMADLMDITRRLEKKGVGLRILAMNLDTSTPTGKLMMNVLGSVAQFEREMMLERQREGIAKARAEGKYRGRPVSVDQAKIRELVALGIPKAKIAKQMGISRETVYRALDASQ
jgi:DNA invertase Pin-like site-specific DNA recombinase